MAPRPLSFPRLAFSTPGSPCIPPGSSGLGFDGVIFGPPFATTSAYTGSVRVSWCTLSPKRSVRIA